MTLVIRTLFNNQAWAAPCKNPGKDKRCVRCFELEVAITPPSPQDEVCSGNCWERDLCVKYRWGRTPKGQTFGARAQEGDKVFFVYRQLDGKYTLWGEGSVRAVDDQITPAGGVDGKGVAFVRFNPFNPLSHEKQVKNLSDKQLVGKKWGQGSYRYIDSQREAYLEQLIEKFPSNSSDANIPVPSNSPSLSIEIMPSIKGKLEQKALSEGRSVDEVVREAIAEWLKERER